jgi:hypothetical protein
MTGWSTMSTWFPLSILTLISISWFGVNGNIQLSTPKIIFKRWYSTSIDWVFNSPLALPTCKQAYSWTKASVVGCPYANGKVGNSAISVPTRAKTHRLVSYPPAFRHFMASTSLKSLLFFVAEKEPREAIERFPHHLKIFVNLLSQI